MYTDGNYLKNMCKLLFFLYFSFFGNGYFYLLFIIFFFNVKIVEYSFKILLPITDATV